MKKTLLLAAISLMAFQAKATEIKPYIGLDASIHKANMESDYDEFAEDTYKSFSGVLGAKLHKNFGLEAFYQQSGEESKTNNDYGLSFKDKTKFNAYGLDLQGYLPVPNTPVELIGSVGLGQYKFKEKATISELDISESADEKNLGYRFGIGAQYNINENWGVRAMVRYVDINEGSDDVIKSITEASVGLRYTF